MASLVPSLLLESDASGACAELMTRFPLLRAPALLLTPLLFCGASEGRQVAAGFGLPLFFCLVVTLDLRLQGCTFAFANPGGLQKANSLWAPIRPCRCATFAADSWWDFKSDLVEFSFGSGFLSIDPSHFWFACCLFSFRNYSISALMLCSKECLLLALPGEAEP